MLNTLVPQPKTNRWIEPAVIFAFWTLMATLTAVHRVLDPRYLESGEKNAGLLLLGTYITFYIWALVTPLVFRLCRRVPLERSQWIQRVILHFVVALGAAMMVDFLDDLRRLLIYGPLGGRGFDPLRDLLQLGFLNELTIYFAVLAAGFARDFFLRYRERQAEALQLRAEAAQLQTQLAEARLKALRMQVNPHFLFNTLHAVSSLAERDPKGVRRMIARLSTLLRYTLEETSAQEVPLRQELEFLDGYLEIQQIRFQDSLEVDHEVGPDVLEALVPNLILQPLVENAIKHGVSQIDGKGRIEIQAHRAGARLVLSVSDNGPGFSGDGVPNLDGGVGLRNTRARLEALYGSAAQVRLRAADTGGTIAEVTLPFHLATDLVAKAVPAQ